MYLKKMRYGSQRNYQHRSKVASAEISGSQCDILQEVHINLKQTETVSLGEGSEMSMRGVVRCPLLPERSYGR